MKTTNWRESRLVMPIIGAIGGVIGGFVFGFSTVQDDGWDALSNVLPWLALLIGFNALSAWTGHAPEFKAAPQDLILPALYFAVVLGVATAAVLMLRDQGWSFSLTTGLVVAVGATGSMLLSGYVQIWVRSLRD